MKKKEKFTLQEIESELEEFDKFSNVNVSKNDGYEFVEETIIEIEDNRDDLIA